MAPEAFRMGMTRKVRTMAVYDTPHFWLEAVVKRETRMRDWVIRDYMIPRLVERAERLDGEADHYDVLVETEVFLDMLGPDKEQRCFECAVPDALRELAKRHPEEYDELLGEKFMLYATERERLGLEER